MLPTFSYFTKVLCIRGMWVIYSPDISFSLKPCDLKFGIHVVKTLLL